LAGAGGGAADAVEMTCADDAAGAAGCALAAAVGVRKTAIAANPPLTLRIGMYVFQHLQDPHPTPGSA
jgi:hypothetical protein